MSSTLSPACPHASDLDKASRYAFSTCSKPPSCLETGNSMSGVLIHITHCIVVNQYLDHGHARRIFRLCSPRETARPIRSTLTRKYFLNNLIFLARALETRLIHIHKSWKNYQTVHVNTSRKFMKMSLISSKICLEVVIMLNSKNFILLLFVQILDALSSALKLFKVAQNKMRKGIYEYDTN